MAQFDRSAGIFKVGVFMAIGGPIVVALGALIAVPNFSALYIGDPNRGGLIFGAMTAVVGSLLTIVGCILILVAVYRALVKIDALPVRTQPRSTSAGHNY
jgi:hypothetical protein